MYFDKNYHPYEYYNYFIFWPHSIHWSWFSLFFANIFVVKYLGGSREVATGKHFLAFQCKAQTRDRRCKCSNIPWLYLKVTKWIKYTRIQLCLPWILHEIGSYHFFVKFNVFMEFVRWFLQIFVECMIRYLNFQTLGIRFFDIIPSLASCGLWEKSPETPLE